MTTQQPEALRLAQHLEQFRSFPDDLAAADELRRQHARIVELEAKQEAAPQTVPDERTAFEAWLGIKPCGAAHDFGWAAWQARAALAATQPAAQGMESSKLTDKLTAALIAMRDIGALEDGLLGDDPQVVKAQKASRKALDAALAAQAKQWVRDAT